jgi:hypothetical protein
MVCLGAWASPKWAVAWRVVLLCEWAPCGYASLLVILVQHHHACVPITTSFAREDEAVHVCVAGCGPCGVVRSCLPLPLPLSPSLFSVLQLRASNVPHSFTHSVSNPVVAQSDTHPITCGPLTPLPPPLLLPPSELGGALSSTHYPMQHVCPPSLCRRPCASAARTSLRTVMTRETLFARAAGSSV